MTPKPLALLSMRKRERKHSVEENGSTMKGLEHAYLKRVPPITPSLFQEPAGDQMFSGWINNLENRGDENAWDTHGRSPLA